MQRLTLVHPNEFSWSNSPPEILRGESPSCESLPTRLRHPPPIPTAVYSTWWKYCTSWKFSLQSLERVGIF